MVPGGPQVPGVRSASRIAQDAAGQLLLGGLDAVGSVGDLQTGCPTQIALLANAQVKPLKMHLATLDGRGPPGGRREADLV